MRNARAPGTSVTVWITGDKPETLDRVLKVYNGSDGDATRSLYAELTHLCGPVGEIATNLLRASKTSSRAKAYRGRGFKGAAYDTKQWSMDNLTKLLVQHAVELGIMWGWGEDAEAEFHRWVLYIDLPGRGQVSFHTSNRGDGPGYPGKFDGAKGASAERIVRFAAEVLDLSHQRKAA